VNLLACSEAIDEVESPAELEVDKRNEESERDTMNETAPGPRDYCSAEDPICVVWPPSIKKSLK
jgi:hypothetical protein